MIQRDNSHDEHVFTAYWRQSFRRSGYDLHLTSGGPKQGEVLRTSDKYVKLNKSVMKPQRQSVYLVYAVVIIAFIIFIAL